MALVLWAPIIQNLYEEFGFCKTDNFQPLRPVIMLNGVLLLGYLFHQFAVKLGPAKLQQQFFTNLKSTMFEK